MKIIYSMLVLILAYSAPVFSYSHSKCMRATRNWAAPFNVFLSSSSFFTSTGDCAMFGSVAEQKQQFIAINFDQIKVDSARGQGEYLDAYASMSGCSVNATQKLGNALQNNFTKVFGQQLNHSPEQTYRQIESLILSDLELKNSCRPKA